MAGAADVGLPSAIGWQMLKAIKNGFVNNGGAGQDCWRSNGGGSTL
jgi:hypothetical protein